MTRILIIAASSIVLAAILLYACLDPAGSVFFPKCMFYVTTGLKCPGCGSQRAIHEMLHLHLGEAFRYNAFLFAAIPFLIALGISWLGRERFPQFYRKMNSAPVIRGVLIVVIFWWVFRNISGL